MNVTAVGARPRGRRWERLVTRSHIWNRASPPCYNTTMRFTLYPINGLAEQGDDEPFDARQLPFDICEGVRIEAVAFRPDTFDMMRTRLGEDILEILQNVRYALVRRYEPEPVVLNGITIGERQDSKPSDDLMRNMAACLRLIRPMRQHGLLMRGSIRDQDGSFDVTGFDVPNLYEHGVPEVQRLFSLRKRDADSLRAYAPEFLHGMGGDVSKFRMAVQFHELGFFQSLDWKARYTLWCSAIEAIYTSHRREHRGSLVATSRIKWFLGQDTSIYAAGDLTRWEPDPEITVGDIVNAIYNVRNFLAHGDRIPDLYFGSVARRGLNGEVKILNVLLEATSFILRTSLLKILRDGLLNKFADAEHAEAYFGGHDLTWSKLDAAARAAREAAI